MNTETLRCNIERLVDILVDAICRLDRPISSRPLRYPTTLNGSKRIAVSAVSQLLHTDKSIASNPQPNNGVVNTKDTTAAIDTRN